MKRSKKIRYPEVIRNHFQYRDAVDANNSDRMYPIALEETWKTTRWPCRVFQFFVATTEVNTRNALHHLYGHKKYGQIEFRRLLSKELIYNQYLQQEKAAASPRRSERVQKYTHNLLTVPPFMTFHGARLVRATSRYPQRLCQCKARRCRTYCQCSPGVYYCPQCYAHHVAVGVLCPPTPG